MTTTQKSVTITSSSKVTTVNQKAKWRLNSLTSSQKISGNLQIQPLKTLTGSGSHQKVTLARTTNKLASLLATEVLSLALVTTHRVTLLTAEALTLIRTANKLIKSSHAQIITKVLTHSFYKLITSSHGQVVILPRAINKLIQSTHSQVLTLARVSSKILQSSHGQLVTLARITTKRISLLSGELITLARSLNKVISVVSGQTLTLALATQKVLTVSHGQVLTLARVIKKLVAITSSQLVTAVTAFVAGNVTTQKIVSVSQSQVITVAWLVTRRLLIAIVETSLVTLATSFVGFITQKTLAVSQSQVVTLGRTITKIIALLSNETTTLVRSTQHVVSLLAAQALTLARTSPKSISLRSLQLVNAAKARPLRVALTSAEKATVATVKVIIRQLAVSLKHGSIVFGHLTELRQRPAVTGKSTRQKLTANIRLDKIIAALTSQVVITLTRRVRGVLISQSQAIQTSILVKTSFKHIFLFTSQLVPRMTWLAKTGFTTMPVVQQEALTAFARKTSQNLIITTFHTFYVYGALAIEHVKAALTGSSSRQLLTLTPVKQVFAGHQLIINLFTSQLVPQMGLLLRAVQQPAAAVSSSIVTVITQQVFASVHQLALLIASAQALTLSTLNLRYKLVSLVSPQLAILIKPFRQVQLATQSLLSSSAVIVTTQYLQFIAHQLVVLLASSQAVTAIKTVNKLISLVSGNLIPGFGLLFKTIVQPITMTNAQIVTVITQHTGMLHSVLVSMTSAQVLTLQRLITKFVALADAQVTTLVKTVNKLIVLTPSSGNDFSSDFGSDFGGAMVPSQIMTLAITRAQAVKLLVTLQSLQKIVLTTPLQRALTIALATAEKLTAVAQRLAAIPVIVTLHGHQLTTLATRVKRRFELVFNLLSGFRLRLRALHKKIQRQAPKLIIVDASFGSDEVLRVFQPPPWAQVYQSEPANLVLELGTDISPSTMLLMTITKPDRSSYQVIGPTMNFYIGEVDMPTMFGTLLASSYAVYVADIGEFDQAGTYTAQLTASPFSGDPGQFVIYPTPSGQVAPSPPPDDIRDI